MPKPSDGKEKKEKKVSWSELLGTQGDKAFKAHKNDETVEKNDSGELPANVRGIARLVSITVGKYKSGPFQGKPYFMASGIVVRPKVDAQGLSIKGLRTNFGPEPLCDTSKQRPDAKYKTFSDHFGRCLNELRLLGADTSEIDDLDGLQEAAEALIEEAPAFTFRTWASKATKQYPNPRTNHEWLGVTELDDSGDEDAEIEDDSEEVDEEEESEDEGESEGEDEGEEESDDEEESDEEDGEEDLSELAKKADKKDSSAQKKLTKLAKEAGIKQAVIDKAKSWKEIASKIKAAQEDEGEEGSEEEEVDLEALGKAADSKKDAEARDDARAKLEEVGKEHDLSEDDYETWTEFAEAISEAQGGGEEDEEESEEEESEPEKGEVYNYKPKGAKKPCEVEVTAVFPKNKTVNCKNMDTEKMYKGVKWSEISAS